MSSESIEGISKFVFVSEFLRGAYQKKYPKMMGKDDVIYNGIDEERWSPSVAIHPNTDRVRREHGLTSGASLLFVGRTASIKGLHCLIEAIPLMSKSIPNIKLVVAGSPFFGLVEDDPYVRRLRKRVKRLGIEEAVRFTGYVDREKLPSLYAACDLTVVPSLFDDPLPKVVIESSVLGIPVVGSRRGGIPEMIDHGRTGVIIDNPEKPDQIATSVLDLLLDEGKRQKMGRNARLKVLSAFTHAHRMNRWTQMYRDLLGGNRKPQVAHLGRTHDG